MQNFTTDPDPESARILGVVLSIYAVIGIPANLFVVFATLNNKNLRSKSINLIVLSLALSDIMCLLFDSYPVLLYSLTFDVRVCKFGGFGWYAFNVLSAITPAFLAICRYVFVCSDYVFAAKFKFLTTHSGIVLILVLLWTFIIGIEVPYLIADKFGLDVMGVCGMENSKSTYLLLCFLAALTLSGYVLTLIFYRKLDNWIRETSTQLFLTNDTQETIEGR
jgi:hypothetical protein